MKTKIVGFLLIVLSLITLTSYQGEINNQSRVDFLEGVLEEYKVDFSNIEEKDLKVRRELLNGMIINEIKHFNMFKSVEKYKLNKVEQEDIDALKSQYNAILKVLETREFDEIIFGSLKEIEVSVKKIEEVKVEEERIKDEKRAKELERILKNKSSELKEQLNAYINSLSERVSISLDFSGKHYGYREDDLFIAASTVKVLMALAVIDNINNGNLSKNQFIVYDKEKHYQRGAGIYQFEKNFKGDTLWNIVKNMIVHSDNIAKNMVQTSLPSGGISKFYKKLTGKTLYVTDTSYLSAKDNNIILNYLDKRRNKNLYNDIYIWLGNTENKTRIMSASKYNVYHKIGDLVYGGYVYSHDMALVKGKKNYTISIMVEGYDANENYKIIEDIIRIIEKKI